MKRTDIINFLIKKYKFASYLEIGVREPEGNFNSVQCPIKIGIDPMPLANFILPVTSDVFFATNQYMFDIIFIDGLHHSDQVEKDIINSLKFLNDGGVIIAHDMHPTTEKMQEIPLTPEHREWTGDCWKAWVRLRTWRNDLTMRVVDTDSGCGIIQIGEQSLISVDESELTYENFCKNKKEWLNLISTTEFYEIY